MVITLFVCVATFVLAPLVAQAEGGADPPTATVLVIALNVREGPGTTWPRLEQVAAGDELVVLGKSDNCSWLYVETPTGTNGWVSGNSRYVHLGESCAAIPLVAATAVRAGAAVSTTPASADSVPVLPTPAPTPQPVALQYHGVDMPQNEGCVAFGAYAGPDLYLTVTNKEANKIVESTLRNNQVTVICFVPGHWTMTVSPIANFWIDLNGEFDIAAGETFEWTFWRE